MFRTPSKLFEIDIKFYFHACLLITFVTAELYMEAKRNKGESVKESRLDAHKSMVTNPDIQSTLTVSSPTFVWSTSIILT